MKVKKGVVDYREYKLSVKEFLGYGCVFLGGAVLAGWLLFARLWLGILMGTVLLPLFFRKLKTYLRERRKARLEEEFCRFMQLAAAALAGVRLLKMYSVRWRTPCRRSSPGKVLCRRICIINRLIGLNHDSAVAFESLLTGPAAEISEYCGSRRQCAVYGRRSGRASKGGVNALRLKQDTEREIRRTVALPKMNPESLPVCPLLLSCCFVPCLPPIWSVCMRVPVFWSWLQWHF